jgi:hypothetical protein
MVTLRYDPHAAAAWTLQPVRLPAIADLDEPIRTYPTSRQAGDEGIPVKVRMELEEGVTAVAYTPLQYKNLIDAGYACLDLHDMCEASWFEARLYPALWLAGRDPSRWSALGDIRLDHDPLRLLPFTNAGAGDSSYREWVDRMIASGRPWFEIEPEIRVLKATPERVELGYAGEDEPIIIFSYKGRGDMNGDGWEDIALMVTHGAYRSCDYGFVKALSRRDPDAPLHYIDAVECSPP